MKRLLKVGEPIYSQSFRSFAADELQVFPQREQYLLQNIKDLEVGSFTHSIMNNIEEVAAEREKLAQSLKKKRPDFFMVDNPLSSLVVSRSLEIPLVFDCIDWYDEIYLREFGVDKRYHMLRYGLLDLLERADKVVAQSPVILESLKTWGLKTKEVAIIPNGYDHHFFYRYEAEKIEKIRHDCESKYSISLAGRAILVYSGKLSASHENLVTICQALDESQVLFIVGSGPALELVPAKPNIIKCGHVPFNEVPDYTNLADVLVFPVDSDCSPIVVSEYLAVGKPIVMPRGRIQWLLEDGKSGCLVDNNVYSWRSGISRALSNREQFGRHNLQIASDMSWERLGKKFSDFVLS